MKRKKLRFKTRSYISKFLIQGLQKVEQSTIGISPELPILRRAVMND